MSEQPRRTIHVLVVQLWTSDVGPIETALEAGDLDVDVRRADFEAALHAALARHSYDVVVLDRDTPGMSEEIVRRACETFGASVPVVVLGSLATLADDVRAVLEPLRN